MAKFLIYSREHNMWWRPDSMGYTCDPAQAGQYDEVTAQKICDDAREMPHDLGPCEFMIQLFDDERHGQSKESMQLVDQLQDKLEKAEAALQTQIQDAMRQLVQIYSRKAAEYSKRAGWTNMRRDKIYADCYSEMASQLRQSFELEDNT